MGLKAADFPPGLKLAFRNLCNEAAKAGWLVWIPQQDEEIIDGFACGNEHFLKRIGIAFRTSEPSEPIAPSERTH